MQRAAGSRPRLRRRRLPHGLTQLETAVRLKLDLTVLIVRDDGYGMIRWKQAEMGFEDFGMGLTNPDFVRLRGSLGPTATGRPPRPGSTGTLTALPPNRRGVHVSIWRSTTPTTTACSAKQELETLTAGL